MLKLKTICYKSLSERFTTHVALVKLFAEQKRMAIDLNHMHLLYHVIVRKRKFVYHRRVKKLITQDTMKINA